MKLLHYFPVIYIDRQLSRELTHYQADLYDQVSLFGWNEESSEFRVIDANHPRKNLRIFLIPGMNLRIIPGVQKYPILHDPSGFMGKLDFDVLHLNSHLNLQAHSLARQARSHGKGVVLTVHGVIGYYDVITNLAQRTYVWFLTRSLFRRLDHIICLTESDRSELVSMGMSREKLTVIPNGVNEDFFRPGPESASKTVVWHGRFIPQKGIPDLVRSARLISRLVPSARFELSGWGPQESHAVEMVSSSGLESRFSFKGKQDWATIPSWLSQGQVYLMPSYREGMPYALLETMSCGTPAVAYAFPAASEIIDDGVDGFLVEIGDYESLARRTAELLLDDDLRRKLGANARKKIEAEYGWQRIAQRYDEVYRGLKL